MPKIEIINPLPGGASHTTINRAADYCRRNKAIIINNKLLFRSHREYSDIYVNDDFDIKIIDGFKFPRTQWIRGKAKSNRCYYGR